MLLLFVTKLNKNFRRVIWIEVQHLDSQIIVKKKMKIHNKINISEKQKEAN